MDYQKINNELYNEEFWKVDRNKDKWFSKFVKCKMISKYLEGENNITLLDAGGGFGNYAWQFKDEFKHVIVSDISERALSCIPEKDIEILHCSILSIPMCQDKVDVVFLIDILGHLKEEDIAIALKEINRILIKGGISIIYTSNDGQGLWINEIKRTEPSQGHLNRLKRKELFSKLKDAGFYVEDWSYYSIIFQQLTDYLKNKLAKESQEKKEQVRNKQNRPIIRMGLKVLRLWEHEIKDMNLGDFNRRLEEWEKI